MSADSQSAAERAVSPDVGPRSLPAKDIMLFRRGLLSFMGFLLLVEGWAPSLTDSQQRVYAAWDACQAARRIDQNIQLRRVEPDGRYWVTVLGGQAGREEANMCMNEKLGGKGRWQ